MDAKGRKLNWRQACELLGCGKDKFYDLINRGELMAYRTGLRGVWVWEADVRALIVPVNGDEQLSD